MRPYLSIQFHFLSPFLLLFLLYLLPSFLSVCLLTCLTMNPRMALIIPSCFYLPSSLITGMNPYIWFMWCWDGSQGLCVGQASTLPTKLQPLLILYFFLHLHAHARAHTRVCECVDKHTHVHTHTHTYTHMHTHIHTHTHAHTHVYKHIQFPLFLG